jgi:hypothetical protein
VNGDTPMNTILRAATVVGMTGLLLGCATQAQRQYQAIATSNQAVGAETGACITAVCNAPEAVPLRPHFSFSEAPTLQQLSDTSLATKPEIEAILLLYPRLQACRTPALQGLANTMPGVVPALAKASSDKDDAVILLIQRKLAWGEFVRHWRDMTGVAQAALLAEGQRITAALEQSHEAELAQRRAAIQAAGAALQQYGQAVQRSQTTFTNCMRFGYQGNMVNCTTY